jgi:predicted methyltransferase
VPVRAAGLTLLAFTLVAAGPVASETAPPAATPAASERRLYEATSRRTFEDVAHWVAVFDDPTRDAWQKPAEVVAALALAPGMWVADLGAGTGYFSRHLAAAVGPAGAVFAVETEPNLVRHLRERAEKERTPNVIPLLASFANPRLPPAALDLVLIVDTFHHIDARLDYFRNLRGVLKPAGRIAIIDWHEHDLPVGPERDHKLPHAQVVEEMRAAGFTLVEEPAVLPYQYFLIFRPG